MLTYNAILKRLNKGEIFRAGTWDISNLRATGYDLRIADDYMIVPDKGFPTGRRYKKGEKREQNVILKPGDVAFVSTAERICLPWDIAGNIGPKFSLASSGLLLLTGLIVDPGDGYKQNDKGEWIVEEDARLHFLLANLGPDEVKLRPGQQKIASIQFFETTTPPPQREYKKNIATEGIDDKFFANHDQPLILLSQLSSLSKKLNDLNNETTRLKDQHSILENRSSQILMFGVYLISTTIFSVALSSILQILNSIIQNSKVDPNILNLTSLAFAISLMAIVAMALYFFYLLHKIADQMK